MSEDKLDNKENMLETVEPNTVALKKNIDDESLKLLGDIVAAGDENELSSHMAKFNLNMSKKNLLRLLKYNELLDEVSDQALQRVKNNPDELTNLELLNFIKVTQESINNSRKTNNEYIENARPITLNQQNNNINVNVNADNDNMDRQSKERIMQAVKKLLAISAELPTDNQNDQDIIDITEDQ